MKKFQDKWAFERSEFDRDKASWDAERQKFATDMQKQRDTFADKVVQIEAQY